MKKLNIDLFILGRPLVHDPSKPSSQELARTHIVEVSPGKLITGTHEDEIHLISLYFTAAIFLEYLANGMN